MRRAASFFGVILSLWLHVAASAAPPDSARSIGSIDFFGLRKVSEAAIRKHLPFKEGDPLMDKQQRPDGAAIAQAIGVAQITLAYICCTLDQKVMVYVGVAEKPVRKVRTPPVFTGTARLSEDMIRADEEFGTQVREAISRGQASEDHSQGHALGEYPPLRAVQQKFLDYARNHAAMVSEVLATSADTRHRAVAAVILGYAPDKRAAATALAHGVYDSSEVVRNNSTRALGVIAEYSVAHPELGIRIDPKPFVEMLNSVVWTDLNKGLMVLTQLTAGREPGLMKYIGERTRLALINMCRWKNPGHSFQACLVLRRVEGLPDFSGVDDRSEVLRKVGAGSPASP
jgi:hypothetical protein